MNNQWQPCCFPGTVTYPSLTECLPATNGSCMTLPDICSHFRTLCLSPQGHIYTHARLEFMQRPLKQKPALVNNYCSSLTMSDVMWGGLVRVYHATLGKRYSAFHLSPRNLNQQITISSIPWKTTFVENLSQMRQTCGRNSQTSLRQRQPISIARTLRCWGNFKIKVSGWRWWLLWELRLCQICFIPFYSNK